MHAWERIHSYGPQCTLDYFYNPFILAALYSSTSRVITTREVNGLINDVLTDQIDSIQFNLQCIFNVEQYKMLFVSSGIWHYSAQVADV